MKERPILFNGDMVRAILDGRKTQTRRALSPQPDTVQQGLIGPLNGAGNLLVCKHGQPGDRLWVREAWAARPLYDDLPPREIPPRAKVYYTATPELGLLNCEKHRPSIHMPRWASRITLEITGVRVERLQEISLEDAKAEGLTSASPNGGLLTKYGILPPGKGPGDVWESFHKDPRAAFGALWESINGPGSWDANPWVWVIEFERRVAHAPD